MRRSFIVLLPLIACAPTPASPSVAASASDAGNTGPDSSAVEAKQASGDAAIASESVSDAGADAASILALLAASDASVSSISSDAPASQGSADGKTAGIIAPQKGMKSLEDALSQGSAAANHPAAAGPSDTPFDRGAAARVIGAVKVDSCKTKDGPTGKGHIKITFAPDGHATATKIEDPPFAGTAVGKCVEAKFRAVKVPRFSGAPIPVNAPFKIAD